MDHPTSKRKANDDGRGNAGAKKKGGGLSYGQRMLAKMGYKAGDGLGKDGSGIAEPITVQLRASRTGIGASGKSELTEQQKRDRRRKAEQNGETYVDSDEEEAEAAKRRRRMKTKPMGSGSGSSTPRMKQRYSLEESGLRLPPTLKFLDLTGGASRQITGSARPNAISFQQGEEELVSRVRRDLDAYAAEAWKCKNELETLQDQERQLRKELEEMEEHELDIQAALQAARELPQLTTLDEVLSKLETMPADSPDFETIAVAAVHPFLRAADLETTIIPGLTRLHAVLNKKDIIALRQAMELNQRRKRSTTPFESLCLEVLNRVRSRLLEIDIHATSTILSIIEPLDDIVPSFVKHSYQSDLAAKVSRSLDKFNVRKVFKSYKESQQISSSGQLLPHQWIFELLSVLGPSSDGVISRLRTLLKTMCQIWDPRKGVVPGLSRYRTLFQDVDAILTTNVLPQLADLLRSDFDIDPTDQNLDLFNLVTTTWGPEFPSQTIAELLSATVGPKLLLILREWLQGSPNFEEVGAWFSWWSKDVFPKELSKYGCIADVFEAALHMINTALDGGNLDKFVEEAPQPVPATTPPVKTPIKEPPFRKQVEEPTFKDAVEDWCGEEGLLLIPLREAHSTTGLPLFRLTANAIGRGGTVIYMQGNVLYAAQKRDRSVWKPMLLGEELVAMAEGK